MILTKCNVKCITAQTYGFKFALSEMKKEPLKQPVYRLLVLRDFIKMWSCKFWYKSVAQIMWEHTQNIADVTPTLLIYVCTKDQ